MSFQERLAKQLEQAPVRVAFNSATTFNAQQKPAYDWHHEASQKRSIR